MPYTCDSCSYSLKFRHFDAGWSSLVARRAHNPKVVGSNPAPATTGFYDKKPRFMGLFVRQSENNGAVCRPQVV